VHATCVFVAHEHKKFCLTNISPTPPYPNNGTMAGERRGNVGGEGDIIKILNKNECEPPSALSGVLYKDNKFSPSSRHRHVVRLCYDIFSL
jgi:hypothetical protein